MLANELKKVVVKGDLKFEGVGIILFCPTDARFYKIAFGDGSNADDLCDGCDDYMYLQIDRYDDDGIFEEDYDGGQLDFNRNEYSGYINDENLIRDCLDFLGCSDIENCILITKFNH